MPKTKKRTAPKAKSKAVQKRAKRIGDISARLSRGKGKKGNTSFLGGFRARNAPKRKR